MNTKKTSPLGLNFIFLMLMVVGFQSCGSTRARDRSIREWEKFEWKIVKTDKKENPSWTIYSRKVKESNFTEYKIEGDVKASPNASVAAFRRDIHDQAADLKNKKYPTYDIISESKDSLLTYVIHHEPFPFKDTEMSIMYVFSNDEDGTTRVTWHEAWNVNPVPPSKKLSRVKTFRGYWTFAPTSSNANRAVNSVQFDSKGMPVWLVKPMVTNFIRNALEDIKKETTKKK